MKKKEHGKDKKIPIVNMNYMTLIQNVDMYVRLGTVVLLFNYGTLDSYTI